MARSVDQGPHGAPYERCDRALDAVVGPEPTDLRALPRPEGLLAGRPRQPSRPGQDRWSPTLGYAPVDAEVLAVCERALGALESLGAEIIEVETVFDEDPMAPWLSMVGACLLRTMGPHRSSEAWSESTRYSPWWSNRPGRQPVELIGVFDECHRLNLRLVELLPRRAPARDADGGRSPASHLSGGAGSSTVRRTSTGSASPTPST